MTERQEHPAASHFAFPYYFDGIGGVGGELDKFPLSFPISFLGEGGEGMSPNLGICFGNLVIEIEPIGPPIWINDLAIFYGQGLDTEYIDCRCSRWDVQDYSVIVETWLYKEDVDTLMENIRPGAVRELYKILGKPHFVDSSWQGYNTLRLYPTPSSQRMNDSTLKRMRRNQIIYPKTLTLHPIRNSQWIECKIEGYVSSSSYL